MSRWRNWIPFLGFAGLFGLALVLNLYRPSSPYLSFGLPIIAAMMVLTYIMEKIRYRYDRSAAVNQGFHRWFRLSA